MGGDGGGGGGGDVLTKWVVSGLGGGRWRRSPEPSRAGDGGGEGVPWESRGRLRREERK